MAFEPQTASKPLVDVHKRTTKVNIGVVIGVVLFLVVGIAVAIWATRKEARGEPVKQVESTQP